MVNVIFFLIGNSFSYRFLADWTKLLQECPDYGVVWQTFFITSIDNKEILKHCLKIKYDYLMLINSETIFKPEQFRDLLNKMEINPKMNILSAKSLKKDSDNLGFTLIRKGFLEKQPGKKSLSPTISNEVVIGYETTVIWK